jgi:hypothetical protein
MENLSFTIIDSNLILAGTGGAIFLAMLACLSVAGVVWLVVLKRKGKLPAVGLARVDNVSYRDLCNGGYEMIAKLVLLGEESGGSVFVFAGVENVPVTIAVNVAMTLCKAGKKCLLVDTDVRRDAVAKAFGIENSTELSGREARPYETEFEGLLVWAGHNFSDRNVVVADDLVRGAMDRFDFVVVNMPYAKDVAGWERLLASASRGIIYSGNAGQAGELTGMMRAARCEVVANIVADG